MNDETNIPKVCLKNLDTGETVNIPVTVSPKTRMTYKLICASKCKKFGLEFAKANRAQEFTRMGESFLISCEVALKNHIMSRIKGHPSKGKTLT